MKRLLCVLLLLLIMDPSYAYTDAYRYNPFTQRQDYYRIYDASDWGVSSTNLSQVGLYFVNRSNWSTMDNYPPACGAGSAVTGLGDSLTCGTFLTSYTESDPFWAGNASRVSALESSNTTTNAKVDSVGNWSGNQSSYSTSAQTWLKSTGLSGTGASSICTYGIANITLNNGSGAGVTCAAQQGTLSSESDPHWTANSSTVARTGECDGGEFMYGVSTTGALCDVTPQSFDGWSQAGVNTSTNYDVRIISRNTSTAAVSIKGLPGQSSNMIEIRNSSNDVQSSIDMRGWFGINSPYPLYPVDMNSRTFGLYDVLGFTNLDGVYNPRVVISHYTAADDQYLQFSSTYSSGSGYADFYWLLGNYGFGTKDVGYLTNWRWRDPTLGTAAGFGDPIYNVTGNLLGYSIFPYGPYGNVYLDTKTYANGFLIHRIGQGAECGYTHQYETVDATNGFVGFADATPDAQVDAEAPTSTSIALIAQGAAAQSADLIEARSSTETILFKVTAAGEVNISGISNDGNGKAVCIKSDGNLGTCTTAVNATGYCTCA